MTSFSYVQATLVSLVCLAAGGCGGSTETKAKADSTGAAPVAAAADSSAGALTVTLTTEQARLAKIGLGAFQRRSLSAVINVTGAIDVEPSQMAVVSAPLGGYVRSAGLLPGARVTKGQVLATLESPEFTQMQQEYLESTGRMLFLESEFARQQRLRKDDVNSVKTYEQVASERAIMRARIAGLELKMRQAGISRAGVDSGTIVPNASLVSPITGFIKTSNASIGKYVAPTDVLFEIVNTTDLHLALNVYERDLSRVHVGQTIRFGSADERTLDRRAKVFLIGQATGTDRVVPVHAHLAPGSERGLLPGMFARAWIEQGGEMMDVVPAAAVLQFEGKDYLVLQTGETKTARSFRLQQVERLTEQGGYVGVRLPSGVSVTGATIVVENAHVVLAALRNAREAE